MPMKMIVNIVRMVDHDQAKEFAFGDEKSLKENLGIGFINPSDFEKLGLVKSLRIKLSNSFGNIIIKQEQDENVPEGTVLMPVSIWSNQITGVEKEEIQYKNIEVEVEATRDPVPEYKDLILKIKEK